MPLERESLHEAHVPAWQLLVTILAGWLTEQ